DASVVDLERAILYENGGHSAAAAIELGFKHRAHGFASWCCLGRLDVADKADHFEQQVQVEPLLRRYFHKDGRAFAATRPLFRNQTAIGELLLHAVGIRFRLVDL